MTRAIAALIILAALAGCGRSEDRRILFDGVYFRGGAKAVDRADRAVFDATVRNVSQSLAGARQAVAHEGIKYCVTWFGISDIEWATAPDAETLPLDGDSLTLRGRCIE